MDQNNISFAGAGRLASALCKELFSSGFTFDIIVSEHPERGKPLANACNATWSSDLVFPESTKVIIVAVPDHKLKSVLNDIKCHPGTVVAHTAGSIGLDIFPEHLRQKGIFYPLQTFSKNRNVSFKELPVLIESSDEKTTLVLQEITASLSAKAYFVNSEHRRMLHLAAVFVSNFTNHMLTEGKEIASDAGFSFDILIPLINETISKALLNGPENSQTGPAVRNDKNTIEKHMELLSFSPELQKVYNDLTHSIIEYYKDKR